MKAIQGEVPLDVVLPNIQASNPEDGDIIGVLTKEGISRESTDVMELYRYLRQLNPKSNQAFGYNEVVIRNIHTHLNTLKVEQELRVQITYSERKENYIPATYNIKLLGTFPIESEDSPQPEPEIPDNIESTEQGETGTEMDDSAIIPDSFPTAEPDIPVYKTTNTLEKLIVFTRTLQAELDETKKALDMVNENVRLLEEERHRHREQETLLQDILNRLNYFDSFEQRIDVLENDRHQLEKLKQAISAYFKISHRQTGALLNEVGDETDSINPDISTSQET